MKSLRSSTAIRKPARTLVRVIPAVATVLPPAVAGSPYVGRQVTMPLASAPQVALSRLTRILLLVAVALCLGARTAGAAPAKKLDNNLMALWKAVLQTPAPPNPFLTGGGCYDLGGTVAPFGLKGFTGTCTVKPGTKIFVAASSAECSTIPGDDPANPPGTTEEQLRVCARTVDVDVAPSVSVDDKPVPLTEVETPLMQITLPAGNIFGQPEGTTGQSVAHGWVTLLHPLTPPGSPHKIVIDIPGNPTITTKIDVQPGYKP